MIIAKNRIESKKTMLKHYSTYIEAFNLILRLCKETLKKCYLELESKDEPTQLEESEMELILSFLQMDEKVPFDQPVQGTSGSL